MAIANRPRDETFLEFGEGEWCAHKRAVSEMKAQEYLGNLHIIAETKIHIGDKKVKFGGMKLRDIRPAHIDQLTNTIGVSEDLKYAIRVYRASQLVRNAKPAWYDEAPRRLDPQHPVHQPDEIYHFLLPDPGMANYTDKVVRKLYTTDFERLKHWRKNFIKPLERHEIARWQHLSAMVDDLWQQHTVILARDREATEDPLPVWPAEDTQAPGSTRAAKDAIRKHGLFNDDGDLATPFRRLKLVMDYWCALCFWLIRGSGQLPSLEQWWMETSASLESIVVDLTP